MRGRGRKRKTQRKQKKGGMEKEVTGHDIREK